MTNPLKRVGQDYHLRKGQGVWVEVDDVSVYIRRDSKGVSVDLIPSGQTDAAAMASVKNPYTLEETDGEDN